MDILHPAVSDYLLANCTPADEILTDLAAETRAKFPDAAEMQISHDEGAFLTILARLTNARYAVEVGVFTGYSGLCIARGLAPDGRLLACDVSEEWTALARHAWEQAGVADRIDLILAPALDTLRALDTAPVIDLAFVDADKQGYRAYYEELLPRLRPGGVIALDNVLREGRVLDERCQEPADIAIRELNAFLVQDERVDSVMLPVRDGVTLAVKR